jgi:preprotein translocase subunit SecG
MEQVLLVVQVLLAMGLIGMVLIQRSDSDGFGLSGGGGNLMSGRTAANAMTRITAIFAALFIINSLVLSVMAASGRAPSIIESLEAPTEQSDRAPVVPLAEQGNGDKKTNDKAVDAKVGAPEVPAVGADGAAQVAPKKAVKKVVKPAEADAGESESNE